MAILQGTAAMEAMVVQLQSVMDELDGAANYFEALGMGTQSDQLDGATGKILDVQELLECLLGRVVLDEGPVAPKTLKAR